MHRANALIHLDRVGEAERALAALEQQPLDERERAYLRDQLSHLRSLQGRHDEAIELARLALPVLSNPADPRTRAEAQGQLGAALLEAGRPAEAIEPLRQSLALYEARELVPSAERTQVADELKQAEKLATAGATSPATIQSR
jgi:tetratricopeptide (TPR) repeat protein